jgi:hypothetical protein
MRKCARCGLLSPDQSLRCECGFDFRFDGARTVRGEHAAWRTAARTRLVLGIILLVLGIGITIGTYAVDTTQGGSYFITYGLVISGLAIVVRSLVRLKKIRDIERGQ